MAAIIPEYIYDIFISYRQNDNKHDKWVTEFVNNLKGELESTFKENISVYFDENPHDRLQETHNVNKSLEDKLKCLIFIPILSQTFCDPKSYAWQYEFLPFIRITENDRFGKDVKLRSGNVAGRILPVRIHDLEPEDIRLFEKETGSVLRALDFVFKTSSGVNRPLRANEDHPNDNLNKTFYLDQINKVANAIKEIILGLKTNPVAIPVNGKSLQREQSDQKSGDGKKVGQAKPLKLLKRSLLAGAAIIALLIIAAIFVFPKIFKKDNPGNLRRTEPVEKSIAVLPFDNMSDNEEYSYFGDAMTDEIIMQLCKINEFIVRSRTSVRQYKATEKTVPEIGGELKVNYLIEGSAQRSGDQVRIRVQLIQAASDDHMWGEIYEGRWEDILSVQSDIAKQIAGKLKTVLTTEEIEKIDKEATINPEAYELYLKAQYFQSSRDAENFLMSIQYYQDAIRLDPDFAMAYSGLAYSYVLSNYYGIMQRNEVLPKIKKAATKALELDDQLGEAHFSLGLLRELERDRVAAEKEYLLFIKLNPNHAEGHHRYGYILTEFGRTNEAIKEAQIAHKLEPFNPVMLRGLGRAYYFDRQYDRAIAECNKCIEIDPGQSYAYIILFWTYHQKSMYDAAVTALENLFIVEEEQDIAAIIRQTYADSGYIKAIRKLLNISITESVPFLSEPTTISGFFSMIGQRDEAFEWLGKLSKEEYSWYLENLKNYPQFDSISADSVTKNYSKK